MAVLVLLKKSLLVSEIFTHLATLSILFLILKFHEYKIKSLTFFLKAIPHRFFPAQIISDTRRLLLTKLQNWFFESISFISKQYKSIIKTSDVWIWVIWALTSLFESRHALAIIIRNTTNDSAKKIFKNYNLEIKKHGKCSSFSRSFQRVVRKLY